MKNTWQVDISNDARNVTLICNNILIAIEDGIDVWSYEGAGVAPTDACMPCWRVIAVQFRIRYNNTLLEFVNATEGSFLNYFAQQQPGSYGTFFVYTHDEDHLIYGPSVLVRVLIFPNSTGYWNPPFPEGNGTIATINFKVICQERGLEKSPLSCELALVETLVFDDDGIEIPYNIQNGLYKIWPTNIADINFDGKVDLKDFYTVTKAFGECPGRPRWMLMQI
ncbi:MAG: cohesin domain-containing protein [Candidatus Bathyarchaeales archaeon]